MAFWYKGQRVDGGGDSVPKGAVILWSGTAANIPDGWALCDGQDGRPELRDKFVLGGGGTHSVGETGGAETVALTVAEMPSHAHNVVQSGSSPSTMGTNRYFSSESMGNYSASITVMNDKTAPNTSDYMKATGNNSPHNNMPPYYTLCYIIKV